MTNATQDVRLPTVEPRTDVLLGDTSVRVLVDLPGVSVEGLSLQVERGVLMVDGLAPDRHYRRALALRWRLDIDQDGLNASLSDGVLTVDLPRLGTATGGRSIPILEH